jgi:hypothetical protein
MSEAEMREIKELLLNLDNKLDKMMERFDQKLDAVIEKLETTLGKIEHGSNFTVKDDYTTEDGYRVIQVDGTPQVISWETKDFSADE